MNYTQLPSGMFSISVSKDVTNAGKIYIRKARRALIINDRVSKIKSILERIGNE